VEGKTPDEVAVELGVHRSTVYRWLEREDFAAELAVERERGLAAARSILSGNAVGFARTVVTVSKEGTRDDGPKLKAALDGLALLGITPESTVNVKMSGSLGLEKKTDAELAEELAEIVKANPTVAEPLRVVAGGKG
jgi:hypothetical protein